MGKVGDVDSFNSRSFRDRSNGESTVEGTRRETERTTGRSPWIIPWHSGVGVGSPLRRHRESKEAGL